ncbi:MAG: PAS domain S-box protein, partial [Syntrophobacteraceae bacterium]
MDKDHIRILLIEDDEDDYALVRELLSGLSRADFSLEWVQTYQEGLKELCRGDHDVYLLDYRLGSRDGLELIREATGSGCDRPIIFFTGSGNYEVDMGAMRSGVADYLIKAQLTDDMLERSIRYSIARKKSERELKIYRDRLEDLVKERTGQLETANEKLRLEIAEREQAEARLRESEEFKQAILDSVSPHIVVLDTNGSILSVNEPWVRFSLENSNMEGLPAHNSGLGVNYLNVCRESHGESPEGAMAAHDGILAVLDGTIPSFSLEYPCHSPSVERWFTMTVTPLSTGKRGVVISHTNITERKQAEQKVTQLAAIVESSEDVIIGKNLDGIITSWNRGAEKIYGYTASEIVGKPISTLLPPGLEDEVLQILGKIESGEHIEHYETVRRRKDGRDIFMSLTISPIRNAEGRIVGASTIGRDITERKHAEEALRESEARLKIAMDLAKLVQWEYDVKTGMYSFDDQFYALYGTTSQQEGAALMSAEDYAFRFIPPEESYVVAEAIAKTLATTDPNFTDQREHRIIRADGEERYIIVHWGVVCDHTSRVVKIRGANQDVTERKQTEESLLRSEDRYSRLFEDAVLGIFRSTPEGKIINVNPAYARMFGFDSPEEAKSQVNDVAADLYADPSRRNEVVHMILDARGPFHSENLYKRKDGSIFPGNLHAWAVRDREGKLLHLEGFVEDITERKLAEEQKAKLEAELRQAQKLEAIGTLAGGIAHDFNNILQPIIGYTEMELNELSQSNPVRESLEQVLKASLRAKELIRQILTISRSAQEQQRMPIDISSIIKEALKLLRSTLPTSIELRQKIRKGITLADSTQIHQVLMNLCTNAAHAMDDKGILEVRLSPVDLSESDLAGRTIFDLKPGAYLELTVSDTGCGMDAKTREHIFDPYFTTKEVGKGSGLGLAVVNGIVKRHEGAITVQSEPEKGTTFTIYIPSLDSRPEATMQVEGLPQRGSERILLVDDESTLMEMATSILERLGYKVTGQTDSVNALEVFRLSPDEFDLVITDYTMPKLTGLDLAREVRRIRPDMPVLLCTGFSEKITPDSVKELGV